MMDSATLKRVLAIVALILAVVAIVNPSLPFLAGAVIILCIVVLL